MVGLRIAAFAGWCLAVIGQVGTLAATPLKDSPFGSPSQRDKAPAFQNEAV
jgi:hypothetical protein